MTTKTILLLFISIALACTSNAQSLINKTFIWEGNHREYAVYIPASYDENSAFPLVFNFHGGGGDIVSWMNAVDMRPIADTANFILVYPQAFPDPTDGGSTNWMRKPPTTFDDVPFVDALIDALSTDYHINLDRIYACGYSLGGEFTYELACKLNHRIAAVGIVARTMYIETFNNCTPVHSTGILSILGTDDFISAYDGISFGGVTYYLSAAETHDYWVNQNNCHTTPEITTIPNTNTADGSTVERYTWANAEGCTYVEELKVIGGGHDWPGDFGNMDMNASQEIWNFVSRYDVNGLMDCTATAIHETPLSPFPYKTYPTLFTNQITIENNFSAIQEFRLYATFGELMLSGKVNAGYDTIDLSDLPANIYILEIDHQATKLIKIK